MKKLILSGMAVLTVCTMFAFAALAGSKQTVFPAARGPMIHLYPQAVEPVACSADAKGMMALTSGYQLCACNGAAWVNTGSGEACAW